MGLHGRSSRRSGGSIRRSRAGRLLDDAVGILRQGRLVLIQLDTESRVPLWGSSLHDDGASAQMTLDHGHALGIDEGCNSGDISLRGTVDQGGFVGREEGALPGRNLLPIGEVRESGSSGPLTKEDGRGDRRGGFEWSD